jgi:biopolymer transport protein ExbB
MIVAFASIASAGNVNVADVAKGISQALNTTASGLVIGILATIGHAIFTAYIGKLVNRFERSSNNMLARLVEDILGHKASGETSDHTGEAD